MWRHRDMAKLIEKWKRAASASKSKLSRRSEKTGTNNDKRVTRAIRLIKCGAISRVGRAMESKGLGDLSIPAIFAQMQVKHPPRLHEIDQDVFDFIPEEELQISVDRILPKLYLNAVPRPTRLWNGYLRRRRQKRPRNTWRFRSPTWPTTISLLGSCKRCKRRTLSQV